MIDVKKWRAMADGRKPMNLNLAELRELLDRLEEAERNADRDKYAFNLMCEAVQAIERAVGIDTGGWNGPAPAVDSVRAVVKERAAMAASLADIRAAARLIAPHFAREIERRTTDPEAVLALWREDIRCEVWNEINGPMSPSGEPVMPPTPTIAEQAQRLCQRIEAAGASEQLTEASVLAAELYAVLCRQA